MDDITRCPCIVQGLVNIRRRLRGAAGARGRGTDRARAIACWWRRHRRLLAEPIGDDGGVFRSRPGSSAARRVRPPTFNYAAATVGTQCREARSVGHITPRHAALDLIPRGSGQRSLQSPCHVAIAAAAAAAAITPA